ncbi:MAG: hypothetical protein HOA17_01135 [Candidatus Melainabacteria bacterium]|nr:hypothetical protein [Candidatus Melainabacteria bacterium]
MATTNRTSGVSGGFNNIPSLGTGTAATKTTGKTTTSKKTTNTNDVIANNFLKAPNFGFQNTTIPGQSESARKIGALLQQVPLQQQIGKMISGLFAEGGKMLASVMKESKPSKKDEKPKETQVAQAEPPPLPPVVETEDPTATTETTTGA